MDRGTVHIDRDIDQKDRTVALIIRVSEESCHAYTLCVYFTKCSFLVNGKKVEKFMRSDLPAIHELLSSVVLNGKPVDLKKLNHLLEIQLTQLLLGTESTTKSTNGQLKSNVSPEKKSYCIKCKKPVKSRATYCDIGGHWTHYHCERLSKEEIECREKESNQAAYCCKICIDAKKSDNTHVKQVMYRDPNKDNDSIVNQDGQIMLPKLAHYSSPNKILVEEVNAHCPVCDKAIEGEIMTCSQCDMECHEHCTIKDTNGEYTCYCCDGINNQIDFNNMNELPDSNRDENVSCIPVMHQTQGNNTNQNTENNSEIKDRNTSQDGLVLSMHESSSTNAGGLVDIQKDKIVDTHVCNDDNLNKVQKVDSQKSKEKEIRQSDLRQKEQKLRKKEEDLKIKEKMIEEMDSERIWFKTHIQKLELKINELEKSNNILRNQVGADHSPPILNENFVRPRDKTSSSVERIQERVSDIVLKQVEAQFERVERLLNEQTIELDNHTAEGTGTNPGKEQKSSNCQKHMCTQTQSEENYDNDCYVTSETWPLHNEYIDTETTKKSKTDNVTGEPLFYRHNGYVTNQPKKHLAQKGTITTTQRSTYMYSPPGQQTVKKRVVSKNNNILSNSNITHNRSGSKGKNWPSYQ